MQNTECHMGEANRKQRGVCWPEKKNLSAPLLETARACTKGLKTDQDRPAAVLIPGPYCR